VSARATRSEPASAGGSALAELKQMARQRPALAGGLRLALNRHETSSAELEVWAGSVLQLANANAGPAALLGAFRLAALSSARPGTLRRLTTGVAAATELCRFAGASATRSAMEARIGLMNLLDRSAGGPEAAWWRGLAQLAREEPEAIAPATEASAAILEACGTDGFETFVATALRASQNRARRMAFLQLSDPEARRLLDRLAGRSAFSVEQRRLVAYAAALWGAGAPIRPAFGTAGVLLPRRATVMAGIVRIPETFSDVAPEQLKDLFRAAVAHATAHLAFRSPRREPGSLKPTQVALVGLVEDARVEALAMRRFPGLRRLWGTFHTAKPSALRDAPSLFARLARTLFDPDHEDADGFIAKGRALFAAEPNLSDPELSRRIGGALGNDVGQMRLPFNPKVFVIEPPYRDDNLGFWALPLPPPNQSLEEMEAPVEAARVEKQETDDPREADRSEAESHPEESVRRARRIVSDDDGIVVARYPEWDRTTAIERPDWTTIREIAPTPGPVDRLEEALAKDPGLIARIDRLVRAARVGRPVRLKRQPDGLDLDLDAAIDAAKALRTGEIPDERIHLRKAQCSRNMATTILIDMSESTRDRVPAAGSSVLEVEKYAVSALAHAMGALGDSFALCAFASVGREEVRIVRVKDFNQNFDRAAMARLAGLRPGYSTRLGAALRHAGAELEPIAAMRRFVLVLTDGAPSDIDVADPADLVEDARRAVLSLRARGMDTFGLTLDPNEEGAGAAVFGRSNHLPVRRIEDLPGRLSELYFRLARR
jgi:nitric oxide reductase NorD protein